MQIRLITDSTCDLTSEEMQRRGILFEPLKVLFGTDEYSDKVDLDAVAFYEKLKASSTLPTTAQVNPAAFEARFLEVLAKGEDILGIFISSELSGTYSASVIAKEQIVDSHPELNDRITLIDSRTASFGLGLLVIMAQDYIDAGLSKHEIVMRLTDHIHHQHLYGMLHNLDNLVKGGRLSAGSAFIGQLLNMKPIIEVAEGKVELAHKARGTKKGLQWMVDQLMEACPDGQVTTLAYGHACNLEKLDELKELVEAHLTVENSHIIDIGPVIGSHVGADAVGIAFYKKGGKS